MLSGGGGAVSAARGEEDNGYTTRVSGCIGCGSCGAGRGNNGEKLWADRGRQRPAQLCGDRTERARVRSSLVAEGEQERGPHLTCLRRGRQYPEKVPRCHAARDGRGTDCGERFSRGSPTEGP